MKFSGRKRRAAAPAFALTSMLDVIFLLLCFFVTASVFSQWESEVTISLPSASSAETPGRLPGEVILNVAKDGSVTVKWRRDSKGCPEYESVLPRGWKIVGLGK